MDLPALLLFAAALVVAAGSPGPSIAALVARVLVRGWRDVAPFLAAMWVGEAIWLGCAVLGLAALAETFHWAFLVVKYAGVAYLLWLAWQMWRAPVAVRPEDEAPRDASPTRMFLAGLAVTLGNPKIMVFYMALLPTILDLASVSLLGWLELTATMVAVLMAIDCGYVLLAARARLLLRSPRAMRAVNRISASVMGGAAAAIATR